MAKERKCQICDSAVTAQDQRTRFCSRRCANRHIGRGRPVSEKTRKKLGIRAKDYFALHPVPDELKERMRESASKYTRGKFWKDGPDSILSLSKRTISKVFRRMKLPCSSCGWNEEVCDLHHIEGRKVPNADSHEKLTYVCPNCHRLAHAGKIPRDKLIPLSKYIKDEWKKFYYG